MKPYYSDFIRHCLRFYIKTWDGGTYPEFRSETDKANWTACHEVLKKYSEADMNLIVNLYGPGDTLADKIYALSEANKIPQDHYWNMLRAVERNIAKARGILS